MRHFIFGVTLCLILVGVNVGAMAQASITLSGFSYSPQSRLVGKVLVPGSHAKNHKVTLARESAQYFELGKDLTLRVKKGIAAKPSTQWLDLILASGGGQVDTFRIVKDEFLRNRVIAHRGAWKNTGATENSIAALQHAIKLGCAGSEFDVHMSADSVLVVNHDPDINGVPIEKTKAADLAQQKLANGETLPTLAAYLQAGLSQNRTRLVLEIKPSAISKERGQALAEKVVALVRKYRAQGWVDYLSFDYDILRKVQELEPGAKVAYLNGDKTPAQLAQAGMYGFDYNQNVVKKNPQWITEAQQLGLTVNAWTVNNPETMRWLLEKNADFITTNEPEILLDLVQNLPPRKPLSTK